MTDNPNDLKKRIEEAKARDEQSDKSQQGSTNAVPKGAGMAMRAATDLVSGLIVGGFLGYMLDRWLDTKPWFMIIMFFIGFIAGFVNIYKWQTGQGARIGFKEQKKTEQQDSVDNTEE